MKTVTLTLAILLLSACTTQEVKPHEASMLDQLVRSGCAVTKLQLNRLKKMMTVDCAVMEPEEDYLK